MTTLSTCCRAPTTVVGCRPHCPADCRCARLHKCDGCGKRCDVVDLAEPHRVAEWLREHSKTVERDRVRYEMPVWLAPREGGGE